MEPHRPGTAPADFGGGTIKVVMFDLLRTILVPRTSPGAQLARIYREVTGVRVSPSRALQVTERVHRETRKRTGNPDVDWARMNRRILAELLDRPTHSISRRVAASVRSRVIGVSTEDSGRYMVRLSMRRLLRRLTRRVRLGIASTQPPEVLFRQLDEFGLTRYFDHRLIFCSYGMGKRGTYVHKPTAAFWAQVRTAVGCSAAQVPLVGDSLASDAPAARFGHPVLLYDPCGHQAPFVPRDTPVYLCRSTLQIEATLERLGLPR